MLKSIGAIVLTVIASVVVTSAAARQQRGAVQNGFAVHGKAGRRNRATGEEMQAALQGPGTPERAPTTDPQPSTPDPNRVPESDRPKMLVMHGNVSMYQGRSVAQVDADLRAAAEAQGYEAVVIPPGSSSRQQEQWARARIAKGGIDAVMGFSMGGYTAERLKAAPGKGAESIKSYERLGAERGREPGRDPRFPGVRHMDLPGAWARQAREQAAARKAVDDANRAGVEGTSAPAGRRWGAFLLHAQPS